MYFAALVYRSIYSTQKRHRKKGSPSSQCRSGCHPISIDIQHCHPNFDIHFSANSLSLIRNTSIKKADIFVNRVRPWISTINAIVPFILVRHPFFHYFIQLERVTVFMFSIRHDTYVRTQDISQTSPIFFPRSSQTSD